VIVVVVPRWIPYGTAFAMTGGRTWAPALPAALITTASVMPATRTAEWRWDLSPPVNNTVTS
jgi:hypothetical protein